MSGIKGRGFASLSLERRKEVAALGGRRSHQLGVAYMWNSETAAIAGKKSRRKSRKTII